ncbi:MULTISPECIES: potassium channel family protein [Actinoalloteichus]|uniref:Kef-type K+ ransport system, predicted NAD-binding component n=1 Tax=Actinoalloteichus fjordicus TaxID=1612552 RepID=A0AAC9PQ78_9PSEU|nr:MULTISPECIES: potassium channel family protein [Actinoalloteichus]APU12814.1 Kef-type K+ ransport system, predicted NAD-binding component [Actinoalloteichus fjordicus]APU18786.1 Kef-type K+ ransport system, predicted NAD-binding component [Actinoalloteichus sp. GBA129-24]
MSRLQRYERVSAPVLTVLALLFLAVFAVQVVWLGAPRWSQVALGVANLLIWLVFLADLIVRCTLSEHPLRFLLTHPVDVLVVVLPVLRPLRVLRVFAAGQLLLSRKAGVLRAGQAVVFAVVVLVVVGSLAVLEAERFVPGSNIHTVADALWWAITTVTTVGYGDVYPVSDVGQLVAAALMLVGISLLGVVTAGMSSWFISSSREGAQRSSDVVIAARLSGLENDLGRLLAAQGLDPAPRRGDGTAQAASSSTASAAAAPEPTRRADLTQATDRSAPTAGAAADSAPASSAGPGDSRPADAPPPDPPADSPPAAGPV